MKQFKEKAMRLPIVVLLWATIASVVWAATTDADHRKGERVELDQVDYLFKIGLSYISFQAKVRSQSAKEEYLEKALDTLAKAAQSGSIDANAVLARVYMRTQGPYELEEALPYLIKAAEMGHCRSQCELAEMCEKGVGVKKDQTAAVRWYNRAAAQGYGQAISALARLERQSLDTYAREYVRAKANTSFRLEKTAALST